MEHRAATTHTHYPAGASPPETKLGAQDSLSPEHTSIALARKDVIKETQPSINGFNTPQNDNSDWGSVPETEEEQGRTKKGASRLSSGKKQHLDPTKRSIMKTQRRTQMQTECKNG